MAEETQKARGYTPPGSREEKMISEGGPIYWIDHLDETPDETDEDATQGTVDTGSASKDVPK